jgi:hypothetical protein
MWMIYYTAATEIANDVWKLLLMLIIENRV